MDLKEGMEMDSLVKKNNMIKIILILSILSLAHCVHKDFDFNPWTSLGKKILEQNYDN